MKSERRIWKCSIFFVLLALLAFVSNACAANTYTVCSSGCNYTSIQAAVNAASDGDTIIVRDGTYTENINVDKRLTIRSENGSSKTMVGAHTGDNGFAVSVDWVNISGFTVTNASINGIDLNSVSHCNISHNVLRANNHNGIWMNNATNNIIHNNIVLNTRMYNGIGMLNCSYNNITGNLLLSNNHNGIWMEDSNHNIITQNNASFSILYQGIGMLNCNNDNITGNSLSSNTNNGFWMENSNNITISHNSACNNNGCGILLNESNHNRLSHNTASFNKGYGILLEVSSHNNLITDNNASSNGETGIMLDYSSYNELINNTASSNGQYGIWLRKSPHNTLRRNVMDHNLFFNLASGIGSDAIEDLDNDIDPSNTVNGAPVYIFYKINNTTIEDLYTKKISVVGGNNITIRNINYSDGDQIAVLFTNNSHIENCTIINNSRFGFVLAWSHHNSLVDSNALNNSVGIFLEEATYNEITKNIIKENTVFGLQCGPLAENNLIHHNQFIANTNSASDDGTGNCWDNSYPSGGNFWSNYAGSDNYRGPEQNISGSDGIGDTPYSISGAAGAQDRYPLMHPSALFDTGSGSYPSISGTHNGTITPAYDISVSKLYTYPCPGTGGHTKYAAISYPNGTILAEAHWNGYEGDWHNLSFNTSFTLYANEIYNYTIRTGSYPQIIHEPLWKATGGVITCEEFVDVNGKRHEGGIPAIRLS
jgi:nitrous oxidase accessory protein